MRHFISIAVSIFCVVVFFLGSAFCAGNETNDSYAMIPREERRFGACDMEIADRKAEPPENIRGDIARIYFYMDESYPGRGIVSGKNRKLFEAWDKQDPVDSWECERESKINKIQGNENPFVRSKCSVEKVK